VVYFNPLESSAKTQRQPGGEGFGAEYAVPIGENPTEALMQFASHCRSVGVGYLLLLSFGAMGAHRFYLRKFRTAFAMIGLAGASYLIVSQSDGLNPLFAVPGALILWLVFDLIFLADAVTFFNSELRNAFRDGGRI
jgi:hypothetical protein